MGQLKKQDKNIPSGKRKISKDKFNKILCFQLGTVQCFWKEIEAGRAEMQDIVNTFKIKGPAT